MSSSANREIFRLTKEDYYALPELGPRYQLIDGYFHMAPAPDRAHQHFSRNLEYALLRYLEQNPIGVLYHAPFDVELDASNVYQPDIVFVSNERKSILTKHGITGAPDLIVEVLSPKTAQFDLGLKRQNYFLAGVRELWIVDPAKRELAIYFADAQNANQKPQIGDTLESPLLPGLKVEIEGIFAGYEE